MNKVVTINGEPLPADTTRLVNEELIVMMQKLLSRAQAGEIKSLAYVATGPNLSGEVSWSHPPGDGHRLSTGIMVLWRNFANAWT